MEKAALVGWLGIAVASLGSARAQDTDLDWIAQENLVAREVIVDFGATERFSGQIKTAVLIDAPAEHIWAIIKDCGKAPEYVPTVLSCELLETQSDERTQIFRQRVKLTWFLPSFEHDFRLDYEPYSQINVSHVSGPMKVLEGTWRLVPNSPQGIILIYELSFEPDFPVPGFVIGRMLSRDVPVALAAMRDRAEALFATQSAL